MVRPNYLTKPLRVVSSKLYTVSSKQKQFIMGDLDATFRPLSKGFVKDYTDLLAYRTSFQMRKEIFETTKEFPKEEVYALTDQFRRAIRSVGANTAVAWGKRRYEKHFISKLTDADAERLETQHCSAPRILANMSVAIRPRK